MGLYLDNAATVPLSNGVKEYLISMLDTFGNPSSSHSEGVKSKLIIENVRKIVSQFINAQSSEEIFFTSSGSASNTLGINGYICENDCQVICSPMCHKSIIKTVDAFSKNNELLTSWIKVDNYGEIDVKDLESKLKSNQLGTLVILEYANSEIGTIQDIKNIAKLVHKYNGIIMVDCTGSISTIPLNVQELDVDIATFSAHKIGALKGVGVLYKKENIALSPLIFGSQEQGLFGGTENVIGIASLGKAVELLKYKDSIAREYVWSNIKDITGINLIGQPCSEKRLANNLYVCIKNINGQELVSLMDDLYNIQISTGSACNNGDPVPSSALKIIGVSEHDIHSCIRISFSGCETEEQLCTFCKNLRTCINILKS